MTAADEDGDELKTVEELDAEIERLEGVRDRRKFLQGDPVQRQRREARRDQILVRWVRRLTLTPANLDAIHKAAGEAHAWMFESEWLAADGWVARDEGGWSGPPE